MVVVTLVSAQAIPTRATPRRDASCVSNPNVDVSPYAGATWGLVSIVPVVPATRRTPQCDRSVRGFNLAHQRLLPEKSFVSIR